MMIDRTKLTGPFLISAGSLILATGALLVGGYAMVSTMIASASGDADPARLVSGWLERHDEKMDLYQTRFNGRSVFYTPGPTPRPPDPIPPQPPRPVVEENTTPPPPPEDPISPTYNGPQLLAILGEEIWIRGSGANSIVRVQKGEELEGVKLIDTSPPWTAKLGWSRGEYDVDLFESNSPGISSDAPANTSASIPGIYNEGEIDPASLTRGISIQPASLSPTRSTATPSPGRNVARPSSSTRGERGSTRGNRGRRGDETSRVDPTVDAGGDAQVKEDALRKTEKRDD